MVQNEGEMSSGASLQKSREKPAQKLAETKIRVLESQLNSLITARDSGLSTKNANDEIQAVQKSLEAEKKYMKLIQDSAERQQKSRQNRKRKIEELVETNPEIATVLKIHNKRGRPRVEESQPELLRVIIL